MEKVIRIDGIIGDWGNTTEEFSYRLDELELAPDDSLLVIINSVGGSVIEGWGIYNLIKTLPNHTTTRAEGIAASIASLILLAGDKIEMSEIGMFMIHRASNVVQGNAEELEKQADILAKIDETLKVVYNGKSNDTVTEKMINDWLDEETWMTPQEAFDYGFVEEIVNKVELSVAAMYNPKRINPMSKLNDLLTKLANKIDGADTTPEPTPEPTPAPEPTPEPSANADPEPTPDTVEYMTAEQGNSILDLMQKFSDRLDALENPETPIENVVENAVRKLAKGIKSTGTAPVANAGLSASAQPTYVESHSSVRKIMRDIGEKTKATLNN